jgi:hypothetical protein
MTRECDHWTKYISDKHRTSDKLTKFIKEVIAILIYLITLSVLLVCINDYSIHLAHNV